MVAEILNFLMLLSGCSFNPYDPKLLHICCNIDQETDLFSCSRALGLTRSLLLGTPAPLGLCVAAMMIMRKLTIVVIIMI